MYEVRKCEIEFDGVGKLKTITCTAEMPGNPSDVRTLQARGSNFHWQPFFKKWEPMIQEIVQQVSAQGSEI